MDSRTNLVVAVIVGVAAGAIGPRALAERDRPARAAFEYLPPAGFIESPEGGGALQHAVVGGERMWTAPAVAPEGYTPNVSVTHIAKEAPQTEVELASLARGMPGVFASSGTDWSELGHRVHVRPDGARVAVIEGAARRHDGTGAPYRVLQLAFPEDAGMSLATASFPERGADQWEKDFDATLDTARGVSFRAPPPPDWSYGAWGLSAGVVALMALSVAGRSSGARAAAQSS